MADRTMTALAIIKAQDLTSGVFSGISKKIEGIAQSFRHVGAAQKSIGNIGSSFAGADRHIASMNRELKNMHATQTAMQRGRAAVGAGLGGLKGIGVLGAGYGALETIKAVERAQARFQHEAVRMATAGMSKEEIEHATSEGLKLSAANIAVSQTEAMHFLRNARTIVGSYEEAAKIMDPLLKLRTVAMGAHPERAGELAEDFDKLIKGMEIKGVTQDMPRFTKYMEGMAQALNVFGDTLRPTDYYEMFKYGRQATTSLSDKFMLSTAPTLAQELGGSSAGKAMSTFYGTVIGGKMKDVAAKELAKYDLLDPGKIVRTKTGAVKGILPGGVMGARLAASDPFAWVNDVFLPALAKKGITDKDKIQDIIAAVFRDPTAAQMVSIFATQQQRIMKDWGLVGGAEGLKAAERFTTTDPMVAKTAFWKQLENLSVASGFLAGEAAVISAMARAMARELMALEHARDQQRAGIVPEGQKKFNAWMNWAEGKGGGQTGGAFEPLIDVFDQGGAMSGLDRRLEAARARAAAAASRNASWTATRTTARRLREANAEVLRLGILKRDYEAHLDYAAGNVAAQGAMAGQIGIAGRMAPGKRRPGLPFGMPLGTAPGTIIPDRGGFGFNLVPGGAGGAVPTPWPKVMPPTELKGSAEVHGEVKVSVQVDASSEFMEIVNRSREATARVSGTLDTNAAGSTGRSSPDANTNPAAGPHGH